MAEMWLLPSAVTEPIVVSVQPLYVGDQPAFESRLPQAS
jgi:hypothetical protein